MHNFKTRSLGPKDPKKPNPSAPAEPSLLFSKTPISRSPVAEESPKKKSRMRNFIRAHQILTVLILFFGYFFVKGWIGAIQLGEPFSPKHIVLSAFSEEVATDAQNHTNILLLGVGDISHEAANLTDTIMVASIDHENDTVSMLSIPRDFFIPEQEFLGYGVKINAIYELVLAETGDSEFALEELQTAVEDLLGIEIQYYIKVDFQVLVDVVNALGGIDIYVEEEIYDPEYPDDENWGTYDPFWIETGWQQLDGETALKYARSRNTTSDFSRALRQQQILLAIKDKALDLGIIFSPGKIKELYQAVARNVETNLETSEIIYLAQLADQFDNDQVTSAVLTDYGYGKGGFLIAPDQSLYGAGFIFIPRLENYDELHQFAELYFYEQKLSTNPVALEVVNSTGEPGLGEMVNAYLLRYGFEVVSVTENFDPSQDETVIFSNKTVSEEDEYLPEVLEELIPDLEFSKNPLEGYSRSEFPTEGVYILVLGSEFEEFYEKNYEQFYLE